jgi:hypothetical protein
MPVERTLEMSLSREEFFRLLPAAVGPFEVDRGIVRWSGADRGWTIRLVPLDERQMGRMSVPRHRVELVLEGYSPPEGEAFMERFVRGFLRGGG